MVVGRVTGGFCAQTTRRVFLKNYSVDEWFFESTLENLISIYGREVRDY